MEQQVGAFKIARKRMIKEQIIARGIGDESTINAISKIPRHYFVEEALKPQAYTDAPLNIGEGQTISQPYIVAFMTEALQLKGQEKVLEIGTGCGYQTFVLSMLAGRVYTIERFKSLAMAARGRFKEFKLTNIVMRVGDGSLGWPEAQPFDRILMACVSPQVPTVLLEQLAIGGKMILPVSQSADNQTLLRITRTESGFQTENLGDCRFVRLVGKHGYQE